MPVPAVLRSALSRAAAAGYACRHTVGLSSTGLATSMVLLPSAHTHSPTCPACTPAHPSACRIGTAEVESALVAHPKCAEAAVVGYEHPIKGQGIYAYVTLMEGIEPTEDIRRELIQTVRGIIGAFAAPDVIHWVRGRRGLMGLTVEVGNTAGCVAECYRARAALHGNGAWCPGYHGGSRGPRRCTAC